MVGDKQTTTPFRSDLFDFEVTLVDERCTHLPRSSLLTLVFPVVRIALVGMIVHGCLVRRVVGIHLIGVIIPVRPGAENHTKNTIDRLDISGLSVKLRSQDPRCG